MKNQYSRLLENALKDEVNVHEEWQRLSLKIEKEPQKQIQKNKRFCWSFLKYAAAILLGFIMSSTILLWFEKESEQIAIGTYKVHTDKGEKSYIELPDGSKVWLNTCTTLEYSPDYGITNRDIYLNGEAYFEVAKNKNIPFIVKTNGIDVKALGTAFNISAYSEDSKLVTTLYSGQVSVQPTLTKQEVLLNPNQIAVYYKDCHQIEKKASGENRSLQWRDGILSFEMMQLEGITKMLERNYDIVFKYENQRIRELNFSGTFRNSESINDILKVITTNTSIEHQINKDTIIFK